MGLLARASVVLLMVLVACSEADLNTLNIDAAPADIESYLPYGVPIPEGEELTAVPQPYDPETMGPPIPDLTAALNLAHLPGYDDLPNPMDPASFVQDVEQSGQSLSPTQAGFGFHTNRGFRLYETSAHPFARVQANHDVQNNTVVPKPSSNAYLRCLLCSNAYASRRSVYRINDDSLA